MSLSRTYTFKRLVSSLACKTLASFDWPYAAKLLYLHMNEYKANSIPFKQHFRNIDIK